MKGAVRIGVEHRVAVEDSLLEHAGHRPGGAGVGAMGVAGLPEIGFDTVELAPPDDDLRGISRIDGDGGLVGGIPSDVVAIGIDVDLNTAERPAPLHSGGYGGETLQVDAGGVRIPGSFLQELEIYRLVQGRSHGRLEIALSMAVVRRRGADEQNQKTHRGSTGRSDTSEAIASAW